MGQIADVLLLVGMTLIFAGALRVLTKRPSAITTKPLNNTAEPIALFENVKPDTLVGDSPPLIEGMIVFGSQS